MRNHRAGRGLLAGLALALALGTLLPAESFAQAGQRRDPFRSLRAGPEDDGPEVLPPGKRGLVISRLTVDGIAVTPEERIAVVNMRGRNRAYFLRVGDEVYNGSVVEISDDAVVFKERTTDAFGKPYERDVRKQLTGSGAKR